MQLKSLLTTSFVFAEVFGAVILGRQVRTKRQLPVFGGWNTTSRPLGDGTETDEFEGNKPNARLIEETANSNCTIFYERRAW
jgi:hypothetical protein